MKPLNKWIALGKYFRNELSEKEISELKKSIQSSKEDDKIDLKEIKDIWEKSGDIYNKSVPNKSKAWEIINKKIDASEKSTIIRFIPQLKIAAAIIILLGISSLFLLLRDNIVSTNNLVKVYTQQELNEKIELNDGTIVWLNKKSAFKYPKRFSKDKREVFLEGEAYFDVAKNNKKPFIINAKNTATKVLGTSFNVRAYPDEKEVSVSVISGKVQLLLKEQPSKNVLLSKGDKGIFVETLDSLYKKKGNSINSISWKTGKLYFNETKLSEVCSTLSNYYSKNIIVADPNMNNLTFTANFENQLLEEILKIMDYALDIQHEYHDKEIVLKESK